MPSKYEYYRELGLTLLLWLLKNLTDTNNFHYRFNDKLEILSLTFNLKDRDIVIGLSCSKKDLPILLYEILGVEEK